MSTTGHGYTHDREEAIDNNTQSENPPSLTHTTIIPHSLNIHRDPPRF
jgi:hypothetical protein